MGAARHVGKRLIDGNPLDEGREIAEHLDGGVAQPLVVLEMPADKSELRAEFAGPPSGWTGTGSGTGTAATGSGVGGTAVARADSA